ncbi:11998_t:CDS:2, partial [Entrophospora sp. SA101]
MATANNNDAGSKDWLKERAAICKCKIRYLVKIEHLAAAAHRRQKTDPSASKLVNQLHKERIQGNAEETVDEEYEDLDAIASVPPPEEIFFYWVFFWLGEKVAPKENTITTLHGKETSEDVYQSFMKSVLEEGLATESSLELSFDLKPEDIKIKDLSKKSRWDVVCLSTKSGKSRWDLVTKVHDPLEAAIREYESCLPAIIRKNIMY